MKSMSKERIGKYRELGARDTFDIRNDEIRAFMHRALEEGYDLEAEGFIKHHGFFQAPHTKILENVDIALVGVPMDTGAPHWAGTRHGPEAARKWSHNHGPVHHITKTIPFNMCNVIDYGDVEFDTFSLSGRVENIRQTYCQLDDAGVVPLSVGGEHTMSYPILAALGRNQPLGLIHLDAHADTCGELDGGEYNDGSVFRKAVMAGAVDPERTIQIGIRGRASILWDFSYDSGMRVITADELHERGVQWVMDEVRERLGGGPSYLTIDTDSMDSTCMPGTTLPEPFGLSGREVRDIIRGLRGMDVVGADITELCPPRDPQEISANLVAALLFETLCVLAEARVARTGVTHKTHWR